MTTNAQRYVLLVILWVVVVVTGAGMGTMTRSYWVAAGTPLAITIVGSFALGAFRDLWDKMDDE